MEGAILWQNYYIYREEIGSGSYSKVYKAFDTTTNEFVAIKKMNKSRLSKNLIERFLKEIEILKKIKHPNIIQFRNSLITDKYIFIITEYCDGGSVKDLIQKELNEKEVQHIIHQLVSAMQYLDSIQILHRDIKPDNLLLTKNHTLKMIDFGFSTENRLSNELYSTICGTPMYMSPELLSGHPYSKKSDLWSLGVISYELFHGKNPFGKPKNIQELIHNIKTTDILYRSDISLHFLEFLHSLLVYESYERMDYESLEQHPWFHHAIDSKKNSDVFEIDDVEESEKIEYKTYIDLKRHFSVYSSSSSDLEDFELTESMDISLYKSTKEDPELPKKSYELPTKSYELPTKSYELPRESSRPIDIVPNRKIRIIDNFFEKPNTYDIESHNDNDSIYRRPASNELFNSLPIKIVKNIVKSAGTSPISINNFFDINNLL